MKTFLFVLWLSITFVSCNSATPFEAFELGKDTCHHCKMAIVDARYGGELVTQKGKLLKFDSIECLRTFSKANPTLVSSTVIASFAHPGDFIPAESATLVQFDSQSSPMASKYVAFSSDAEAAQTFPAPSLTIAWKDFFMAEK